MKWVFLSLGLLLSNLILAQKYVENEPAERVGDYYTGYMKDGKYNGHGTYYLRFKGGSTTSNWKDSKQYGKGELILFNGTKVSGTYINDLMTGAIKMEFDLDGSTIYRLRENGKYTSEYKIEYSNGSILKGLAPNGTKQGVFTLTFKDGEQKELTFKDDELIAKEGIVKNNYAYFKKYNGGTYSGEWKDDKPHGKGEYSSTSEFYRGSWSKGLKNGLGYKLYVSGDDYRGMFKDNKLNGKGVFRFKESKAYYEGDFKDNRQHGIGKTTTAIGSTSSGNFSMGKWHGEITFIDSDGKVTSKTYENGTEVKEIAAEVITKPVVAQVETKVKESQYPDKLEGDDLLYFLFTEYEDKTVAYWLEKHPDQLFKEYDWNFTPQASK